MSHHSAGKQVSQTYVSATGGAIFQQEAHEMQSTQQSYHTPKDEVTGKKDPLSGTAHSQKPLQIASAGILGTTEGYHPFQQTRYDHLVGGRPPSRLFALVIAIDQYQDVRINDLHGCTHDGTDFVRFLRDTLRVPPSRIVQLIDAEATRANILDAFRDQLINNRDIKHGDAMVIFYAGHGDRRAAPPAWAAEDNMVETICPHDEGIPDEQGQTIIGIPDRTFDGLMRCLAHEKGDNILAIFDCCHSGGVMREMTGTTRALSLERHREPIPEDLDQEIWTWHSEGASRDVKMVFPAGFSYPAMRSHVLLAACRQDEKAQETHINAEGNTRGLFTLHLLKCLRRAFEEEASLPQLTYARLVDRLLSPEVMKLCGTSLDGQHPLCEGKNRDRLLFSTSELMGEESSFAMQYENGRLYVSAGRIHGVVKGTRFAVQASKARSMCTLDNVVLIAAHVDGLQCIVQPSTADLPLCAFDHTRVVVITWNSAPMKVRTSVPVSQQGLLNCTEVEPKEYHDVSIEMGTDCWILSRFDPLTFRYAVQQQIFKFTDISLQSAEILEAVARWNFYLYHFSDSGPDDANLQPSVQLHRLEDKSEAGSLWPLLAQSGDDLFGAAKGEPVWGSPLSAYKVPGLVKEALLHDMAPYYGLTLFNTSEYDLFPYLFYFNPSTCAIQAWYLPHGSQVKAPLPQRSGKGVPGRLSIGYGSGALIASSSGFLRTSSEILAFSSYLSRRRTST
ncbi:caspase domain-containing protein [Fomitopsis serialis]|uniref:caspase domain-containing protein n=1 Tax=Fomitopsis serialis TaxID=139415 RepID=UPI00200727D8|nr:caspase domain-containing protein [Neoantrodia serialis]KAH9923558.1 caspase domain-containing protein [Neoantrodia serialis]